MPVLSARGWCALLGAAASAGRAGDPDGVRRAQKSRADESLRNGAAAAAVARLGLLLLLLLLLLLVLLVLEMVELELSLLLLHLGRRTATESGGLATFGAVQDVQV